MISNIQPVQILEYWNECTDLYLEHMTTFQAGLFAGQNSTDPFTENAINIALRSGIKNGQRILDLGCGVCGPAIEIAKRFSECTFLCVTNCERQVEVARKRVVEHSLEEQIDIILFDYHDIFRLDGKFDLCLFLESFGYTLKPEVLLKSVYDKLVHGGSLYIKDICHFWHLNNQQVRDLHKFNDTYCYNTPMLKEVAENTRKAGFEIIISEVVTDLMYRYHSRASMFEDPTNSAKLTEFGKRHFKGFLDLPVDFFELKASR